MSFFSRPRDACCVLSLSWRWDRRIVSRRPECSFRLKCLLLFNKTWDDRSHPHHLRRSFSYGLFILKREPARNKSWKVLALQHVSHTNRMITNSVVDRVEVYHQLTEEWKWSGISVVNWQEAIFHKFVRPLHKLDLRTVLLIYYKSSSRPLSLVRHNCEAQWDQILI